MRFPHGKQWLSAFAAAALLGTAIVFPSLTAKGEDSTVYGDPETITVSGSQTAARENNFNDDWKFYLGTSGSAQNVGFDDSGWTKVTLPHDFSISQSFTTSGEAESGFLPGGTGWYRKTFTLPADCADKTVVLNFDGVYSDATVYVNGTQVGENHYGYNNFAFDITDRLTIDGKTENVVAVKAVNNIPSSRWYSGSGIYRDVTLLITDPVHVALDGVYVTTPYIASGSGMVNVAIEVDNDGSTAANVTATTVVRDANGTDVSVAVRDTAAVSGGNSATITVNPTVVSPALWSPDSPTLYTAHTELSVNGTVVDTVDTPFGFRYYSFDSSGFHLNGENVKLNGVCLHHDQGALGAAANSDAIRRQLSIMKDMGVNAIRTAHNPADAHFIDICNELGLLVIEELFDGWVDPKNGNSYDFSCYFDTSLSSSNTVIGGSSSMTWAEFVAKSVVRRDRSDPSVILWSLGNEVQEGTSWANVGSYATIAQNLINWIKEEDTSRPVTSGDNNRGGDSRLVAVLNVIRNNGGVVGFNYANSTGTLESLTSNYGDGVIIATETASHTNSRGVYVSQANNSNADGKYHLTSYDTSAVGWGITAHDSIYNTYQLDCVAGEFVWTGFDYIGEPTPWNGTSSGSVSGSGAYPNSSYFGIVETTGFEKDSYYLYRSQWNKKEMTLHLVTAWDSDNMLTTSGKTPVVIYSNAPVVKLYRDGTLIGTATRKTNTSSAGHVYYTYTTTSNQSSVCSAVSASGSAALYATFNVTYTSGTLSAKAFDSSGQEITLSGNSGKNSVSTPGTVSKLAVGANTTEITADGSSLAYITVDVTDASGNPDTTATNTINFSLSGNGEIVGVDNGDQATTAKYQQPSVLTSTTSAHIAAYAGKALVIVRSTKNAGSFTLTASASGLTGGSVTVTTRAAEEETPGTGLKSYTLVRDYTVKAGTAPVLLTTADGLMSDGTALTGTIAWETVSAETYSVPGDYTLNGVLTFDGLEPIEVTARLHVIANVKAMRNVATATTPETLPTLPSTVRGLLADGSDGGEFPVVWDAMNASAFATAGEIVTVQGLAQVFGDETMAVTASVRVAEAVNTESTNIAPTASSLTQDIASDKQSDVLESIRNGTLKPGDNTSERWTNWNNRYTSAQATLTFTWDTAQMISSVNLYYYYDNCCAYPESIVFSYSLNGTEFTEIEYTAELIETYDLGAEYTYTFTKPVNPVALRITFTQQGGTTGSNCVGLTEAEIMTYVGTLEYESTAQLSGLLVDGTALSDFAADTYSYTASGSAVTAQHDRNMGVTVLPALDGVVRIVTLSEDGTQTCTYAVALTGGTPACAHEHTEVRNASSATCTEAGYTGDTYCTDCNERIAEGETIPATGHVHTEVRNASSATCTEAGYTGDTYCTDCNERIADGETIPATGHVHTEVRDAKAATCTEAGYTGDTYCTDCGEKIASGESIAKTAHTYTSEVTKEPTTEEEGERTYTCTVCGDSYTESIEKLPPALLVPQVTLSVTRGTNGRLALTGQAIGYDRPDAYYPIVKHGIVYQVTSRLGTRVLTINTPGRTNVTFSSYSAAGTFTYQMKPAYPTTRYTVRAYVAYTDASGKTVYVYSNPVTASYNSLS